MGVIVGLCVCVRACGRACVRVCVCVNLTFLYNIFNSVGAQKVLCSFLFYCGVGPGGGGGRGGLRLTLVEFSYLVFTLMPGP